MKRSNKAPRHKDLLKHVQATQIREELPLVHVTATGIGRNILLSGKLETRYCPHLKENLIYFFLGRPAYRLKGESAPNNQINRSPIVFIINPDHVVPKYVFPFDSGAALTGKYVGEDQALCLNDYELPTSMIGAGQHLAWAFSSVDDYLKGRVKPNLLDGVEIFETTVHSFSSISKQATKGINNPDRYDDRAAAIEVCSAENVDLKSAVSFAIIPKQYLEGVSGKNNTEILQALKENEIDTIHYDWLPHRDPEEYRDEINRLVRQHYVTLGLI